MTELTRGQKLANTFEWACTSLRYDDPRKMFAYQDVVDAIDNKAPSGSPIVEEPTLTADMVDAADRAAYDAEENYRCLLEEFLRQKGWMYDGSSKVWHHPQRRWTQKIRYAYTEELEKSKIEDDYKKAREQ